MCRHQPRLTDGARGNSGVILSQVLRGLAGVLVGTDGAGADASTMSEALTAAGDAAYEAVMRPVEGTILTVARESAEAASTRAGDGADLVGVLDAARLEAAASLARTPDLLPVLAEAGVVDAGASGYVLLLDALLEVVDGRPVPEPVEGEGVVDAERAARIGTGAAPATAGSASAAPGGHGPTGDVSELRYEVMFFLDAPDEGIAAFKAAWSAVGDSIVVVGGDGLWNCHIHTDDIGAAVEAGIAVGRPHEIRVTDLHEQVEEEGWVREATRHGGAPGQVQVDTSESVPTAVVAVASGLGVIQIFRSLGVRGIVVGGQTMNPSTGQLLEAVERVPAGEVVILPNNKNIIPVAEQVDAQTTKSVSVVPTCSLVEGFTALIHYDPESTATGNAAEMAAAIDAVLSGEVCRAVRDSSCDLGPISAGDFMGIGPGGIQALADSEARAAIDLLEAMVGDDHELVTILEGEDADPADTRAISEWLEANRPDVGVEIHHGGQPLYPYLFGVE